MSSRSSTKWCATGLRSYLHHPRGLPLDYREIPRNLARREDLLDASVGALIFETSRPPRPGAILEISVAVDGRRQHFRAVVHWVRSLDRRFEVAVRVTNADDAYRARMAEQVCQIEAYRRGASRRAGREIGVEHAARDWIAHHAARFSEAWERGALA